MSGGAARQPARCLALWALVAGAPALGGLVAGAPAVGGLMASALALGGPMASALAVGVLMASAPALGGPGPARPLVVPSRDVDVTYRVQVRQGSDISLLQRLRFSAFLHRQRLDMPTSGEWLVLDFATSRMAMVRDDKRNFVELAAPESSLHPDRDSQFWRLGDTVIAGAACTEWRKRDVRGNETIDCYTADGVLLRARSGERTLLVAVAVTYGAQAPSVFVPPAGFTRQ